MKTFDVTLVPNNARLTCYVQDQSPEMATADIRPAMLVFPGGAYFVCSDREAEPVALAYLAEGYNTFVLRYSVGFEETWEHSFEDAQAALHYIRENSPELHIDPNKIAVVGFSAGGHLASALGTLSEEKPNALVLGYPLTLAGFGDAVGKNVPATSTAVTGATPPTFLFATSNDYQVPIQNSLAFAKALADVDQFFEMHIYLVGEHGFSLGKAAQAGGNSNFINPDAKDWFADSTRFLRHVFGDFAVGGQENNGDLPRYLSPNLDTPVKYLFKHADWAAVMEQSLPGITSILQKNKTVHGLTIHQLSVWLPQIITDNAMAELESAFAAISNNQN